MSQNVVLIVIVLFLSACVSPKQTATVAPIHADVITKSTTSWDGEKLPAYPDGQPEVTVLRITVQPGVELDWHQHPVINVGLMIKGELTVETESSGNLVLKPGDSIVELVDKWHRGVNHGLEPVEIIVFYAGVLDTPISILR